MAKSPKAIRCTCIERHNEQDILLSALSGWGDSQQLKGLIMLTLVALRREPAKRVNKSAVIHSTCKAFFLIKQRTEHLLIQKFASFSVIPCSRYIL